MSEQVHPEVLASIEPAVGWGKHCDELMRQLSESYSESERLREVVEDCAEVAAAAVMKFRRKVGGRYYPGYHEDLRDAVREAVKAALKP